MSIMDSGAEAETGPADTLKPLVLHRKKRTRLVPHTGGAWKIAYADFITAMMAFFLIMWILNVATDQQKKAIARYFDPIGSAAAPRTDRAVLEGLSTTAADSLPMKDMIPPEMMLESDRAEREEQARQQTGPAQDKEHGSTQEREEGKALLRNMIRELQQDPAFAADIASRFNIEETPEGVLMQIIDREDQAMFEKGSHGINPHTRHLLEAVARTLVRLPCPVSLTGHTDARPVQGRKDYSNWELSADRALVCRRVLVEAGLPGERITAVIGRADTDLLVPADPLAPQNRRISILLLYPPVTSP
jgi:chemotaxis protein MotB